MDSKNNAMQKLLDTLERMHEERQLNHDAVRNELMCNRIPAVLSYIRTLQAENAKSKKWIQELSEKNSTLVGFLNVRIDEDMKKGIEEEWEQDKKTTENLLSPYGSFPQGDGPSFIDNSYNIV